MSYYDLDNMTWDELDSLCDEIAQKMDEITDKNNAENYSIDVFCKRIAKTNDLFVPAIELPQGDTGTEFRGLIVHSKSRPDIEPFRVVLSPRDLENDFSKFIQNCLDWFGLPRYLDWSNSL